MTLIGGVSKCLTAITRVYLGLRRTGTWRVAIGWHTYKHALLIFLART
jgi:hypothetical protein